MSLPARFELTPPGSKAHSESGEPELQTYGSGAPAHMFTNFNTPINRDDYKAYSPLMPNNFRAVMNSGSLVLGAGCMIPSIEAARVVASLPHHFCWLDVEHTVYDVATLQAMIRTVNHVSGGRMGVIVRIPQSAPDLVAYCLNAGAAGITFPHVQNVQQAKALVDLCRFPPHGKRGYPPFALFGHEKETGIEGKNTYDVWDDHVCCIAQIEDPEGVDNVEEICAVPGIDALMVGTHDLQLELGIRPPGYFDPDEPNFQRALERITAAASKHGPNGMAILSFSRPGPDLEKRMRRGWRAFKVTTDALAIHQAGNAQYEKVQGIARDTIQSKSQPISRQDSVLNATDTVEISLAKQHVRDTTDVKSTDIVQVDIRPLKKESA